MNYLHGVRMRKEEEEMENAAVSAAVVARVSPPPLAATSLAARGLKSTPVADQLQQARPVVASEEEVPVLVHLETHNRYINDSNGSDRGFGDEDSRLLLGEILVTSEMTVDEARVLILDELEETLGGFDCGFCFLTNSGTALLSKQEGKRRVLVHCCKGGEFPLVLKSKD